MGERAVVSVRTAGKHFGAVAQLEERYTGSVEVRGSSPLSSTKITLVPRKINERGGFAESAGEGDQPFVPVGREAVCLCPSNDGGEEST
jgi:hypothetical protein